MTATSLRIVFMGTPEFASGILSDLLIENYNIVGIVTVADKPAGRGKQLTASPVKILAEQYQIPVLQPTNLKDGNFLQQLKELNPDIQIVIAFRMLPKVVWSLPKFGTFNLHASLLPKFRGAAPINWALIRGEKLTGVTTFFIDDKIDTGAIILQSKIDITTDDNVGTLHDKLMEIGKKTVKDTLQLIASENVQTYTQNDNEFTTAPKLFKENTKIDWSDSLENIHNFIRGLSPYPAAWTYFINDQINGEFKIFKAHIEKISTANPTCKIVSTNKEIKITHSEGYLIIDELQLPSRKKMDAKSLLNGFKFSDDASVL